ncbi:MAG: hypothetical protein ACKOA8_09440, partial [Deltaproteobacteria bacterium]
MKWAWAQVMELRNSPILSIIQDLLQNSSLYPTKTCLVFKALVAFQRFLKELEIVVRYLIVLTILLTSSHLFAETFFYGKLLGGTQQVDRTMNPAISMNGLILGNWGPAIAEGKGLQLQEIEGQFTAAVDPYFFANFILSIEGASGSMSPEEAWVSTLGLPVVSLKVGKFFQNFGKNNLIHTHAQPLIDRPLVNQLVLGEEAFNTSGIQADVLVPLPWYMNLSVAGVTAKTAELYQGTRDEDLANVTRIENLWDLTDATTLGLGASYSVGNNQANQLSHYLGADLTLKYVSPKGRGSFAVIWTNEYIQGWRKGYMNLTEPTWDKGYGVYSILMARIHPTFWLGGRFDQVSRTSSSTDKRNAENLIIAYVPTEFSALRLQTGVTQ